MPFNWNSEWAEQASAPSTPSTGRWKIYFKSGGLYLLEDDGSEHGPFYDSAFLELAGGTMTGDLNMGANEIQNFTEQIVTDGAASGTVDIDWSAGTLFEYTMGSNITFTFSNLAAGRSITLILIQDGTGSRTVTWPASVDWPSATAPTLSTGAADVDVITLIVRADGTTVLGFTAGLDMG